MAGRVTVALICSALLLTPQRTQISIALDGEFDDWRSVQGVDAGGGVENAEANLRGLRMWHDETDLFVLITFAEPTYVRGLTAPLRIAFDADGNSTTGKQELGLEGVDMIVDLPGARPGVLGCTTFTSAGDPDSSLTASEAGFEIQPGFRHTSFEIRLRRSLGKRALFTGPIVRAKAAIVTPGSSTLNATGVLLHNLTTPYREPALKSVNVSRAEGTSFRVLLWNVSNRQMFLQPAGFQRVLRALQPDIVLLDEVWGPRAELERFATRHPKLDIPIEKAGEGSAARIGQFLNDAGLRGRWNVLFSRTGIAYEHSVVATRAPLAAVVDGIDYTDPKLLDLVPDVDDRRELLEAGITFTGGVITWNGRRILAGSVDFACCGSDRSDTWQSKLRSLQARTVRDRVHQLIRADRIDAVLIGGDLNLHVSSEPLVLLADRTGPAASSLVSVRPYWLQKRSISTGSAGQFGSIALDWLLYSNASLTVQRSFIFRASEIPLNERERLKIEVTDTDASNHLPIVADLSWQAAPRAGAHR